MYKSLNIELNKILECLVTLVWYWWHEYVCVCVCVFVCAVERMHLA